MLFQLNQSLLVCLLLPVLINGLRLLATAPVTDVKEGGIMSLHCQIWDFDSSYRVILSRTTTSGSESHELSWNEKIIVTDDSDIADRVYLAVRQLHDGSQVYFMSLTDITRADEGQYTCKIINFATYTIIGEDTVDIGVRYFPTRMTPLCSAMGIESGAVVNEGAMVLLNCTAEQSNPPLTFQWTRSGSDDVLTGSTAVSNGQVISQMVSLRLTMHDNNRLFVCKISNPYFVGQTQSCHVGPFRVIPNKDGEWVSEKTDSMDSPPSTIIIEPSGTVKTVDCLQKCSQSSVAYYWIISTIIAGCLAVLLCIAAFFLVCKYHRLNGSRKRLMNVALHRDGANLDDMYEKVDCRRDEGRMVYMSLKKTMKPGNSVMYVQSESNTHYNLPMPPTSEQHQTRTYSSALTTKP